MLKAKLLNNCFPKEIISIILYDNIIYSLVFSASRKWYLVPRTMQNMCMPRCAQRIGKKLCRQMGNLSCGAKFVTLDDTYLFCLS